MKKVLSIIIISIAFFVVLSNKAGVATSQGSDRTGSPIGLSSQCNACHSGGAMANPTIGIRLLDAENNMVTEYEPGETYRLEIELASSGAAGFAFQGVALLQNDNTNAGSVSALSSNVKVVSLNQRSYIEHNNNTASASGLFSANWVAPLEGSGTVNFYAAGIAANGNGGTSGDISVTSPPLSIKPVFSEDETVSVLDYENFSFKVYPNPTSRVVNVVSDKNSFIIIKDFAGNLIYSSLSNGSQAIDLFNFSEGIYFIILQSNNQLVIQKILKTL